MIGSWDTGMDTGMIARTILLSNSHIIWVPKGIHHVSSQWILMELKLDKYTNNDVNEETAKFHCVG